MDSIFLSVPSSPVSFLTILLLLLWGVTVPLLSLSKVVFLRVLSPILFQLFINDFLNLTQCPIQSYADDTILYFSTSYNRSPTQQELSDSRRDAIESLTSDLSLVSDWSRANLVLFNASKTQFIQLSTRHNLPDNYPLFFNDTQLSLSSTLKNTLDVSSTQNINWRFHTSTLAESASKKLSVLWRLRPFFSPFQLLALYMDLVRPCMEYGSYVWGSSTHTVLLDRVESKAFRLINSLPLTDCLDNLSHRRNVAFLSIFYSYFHADCSSEIANRMPPPLLRPRCTRLSNFSHSYSVHLSIARVNLYLHYFMLSTGKLWNSFSWSVFPTAHNLNSFIKRVLRHFSC